MKMETTRQATREELAKRVDELQEQLEKQDKMIDLMAQTLLNYGFVLIKSKNGLKEYFRKKVENEK